MNEIADNEENVFIMGGHSNKLHELVDTVSRLNTSSMHDSISLGPQRPPCLCMLPFLHQIGTMTCLELRSVEPLCIGGEI